MKNKILSFITKVPTEIKNEFYINLTKDNYARIIPVLITAYVIEWVVFLFSKQLYNTGKIVLAYQAFNTIIIPCLLFTKKRLNKTPPLIPKLILNLVSFGILAFGIALVMATQAQTDLIHMFMMCALAIAAFMIMPPLESFLMYLISVIVFLILLPQFQADHSIIFTNSVNTIVFIFLVWILSRKMFQYKLKDFIINMDLNNKTRILEELLKLDPMTSLMNHKTILDNLESEIIRSNRYGHPLCIILLDLDNFKQVNDRFGHQKGDEVLINLSGILKQTARKTDMIGRYGGEEFIIIMPDTNLNSACQYSKRLQQSLKELILPDDSLVSISGGIAQYNGEDMVDFIHHADTRLYTAKQNGKNQFIYTD